MDQLPQTEYRLENEYWFCRLVHETGELRVSELIDVHKGRPLLQKGSSAPFCQIKLEPEESLALEAKAGHETDYNPKSKIKNRKSELEVDWAGGGLMARGRLSLEGPRLRWVVQFKGRSGRVHFPFLANLQVSHEPQAAGQVLLSETSFQDGQGRLIFRHADWPLPLVWTGPDGRSLTLLSQGPAPAGASAWWQEPGLALTPSPNSELELQFDLILHEGGWPAAFDLFRARARAGFNLAQYQRPDLAWYQDQVVQHFTFLYGREILNLETGRFELDRFLDQAERDFGGYDGFLIWGVYPRIGVDERTQWEFYDDLPGGRSGLQAMARQARARGVRFFIPYKPWDRSADLHGRPAGPDPELLAKLVQEVEADGVFLDTMSAIDSEFRQAIDQVRPGVVFCSEGRAKGPAFEIITGSWDQSPNRDQQQGNWSASPERMPGVDMWRFVFPEHRFFVISRHSVGADRMRIIQRGFFSGMGWVVWQDIFGLILTYSPEEAALLKKCRTIFREHRQALWSSRRPTPLLPGLAAGLYANEFPGEQKRLWTFYNERDEPLAGPMLPIDPRPGCHYVDVWNNQETEVDGQTGLMHLALGPRSVGAVVELPRLLSYRADSQSVIVTGQPAGAVLQVRQAEGEWSAPPPEAGSVSLRRGPQDHSAPTVARLLLDGELLDQIIIQP